MESRQFHINIHVQEIQLYVLGGELTWIGPVKP